MRRRILTAIVGVVALASLVLTLPLAVVLANRKQADAIVELERAAERTAANLEPNIGDVDAEVEVSHAERGVTIGVYGPDGRLIGGTGPAVADPITAAKGVTTRDGTVGDERVLARPITVDAERVATIRVAEPVAEAAAATRRDLLLLLVVDLAAVAVAVIVGAILSARLARPLRLIRDDAVRLGDGDFTIGERTSGVEEIDETSHALAHTASRLEAGLQRERTFSSNASHQLRTPITSMRLAIESELAVPSRDGAVVLRDVLHDLDRLETTIATLLAVARDLPRTYEPVEIDAIGARVRSRWGQASTDLHRPLNVTTMQRPAARVSVPVLDEIFDVLIDNALRHGAGPIDVKIGSADADHLVATVADHGTAPPDATTWFSRRPPGAERHGLGLALARSLAEAEGGRLLVTHDESTTFQLLLPEHA
ncbi:ATP-binding protein [Aquihabitans sp. McL0605]|uniref:sensor histidine kinase n=1 Tax=Aquihabitans sp. McL0605 TaxID=3415671 RepID=UPI003CED6221